MEKEINNIEFEIGSSVWYVDLENECILPLEVKEVSIRLNSKGKTIIYTCSNPETDTTVLFHQGEHEKNHVFSSREKAEEFLNNEDDKHGKLYMLYGTDGYTDHDIQVVVIPYRYIKNYHSGILTERGVGWFRKEYHTGFDNGRYYRLKEITKEYISKLIDKINNYTNIVDLWNQNN